MATRALPFLASGIERRSWARLRNDTGGLSVASVFTDEKANEILSRCSSSGLTSIKIASGQVTFA